MSGQLEVHGLIHEWESICTYLQQPHDYNQSQSKTDKNEGEINEFFVVHFTHYYIFTLSSLIAHIFVFADDWNTDWSWDEEKTMLSAIAVKPTSKPTDSISEAKKNPSWFQECIVANSPAGDLLVIGQSAKAVFLTSMYECIFLGLKMLLLVGNITYLLRCSIYLCTPNATPCKLRIKTNTY